MECMRDTAIRMFFITLMTRIFIAITAFSIPSSAQRDLSKGSNELFLDDFNGTELNSGLWVAPTVKLESCTYQGGDAVVEHGHLNLKARKLNNSGIPPDYSCVQVQSRESFPYNEIEWRASVPHGKGLWSTLWLLPLNCVKVMHCKEPQFMARMNIDSVLTAYMNVEIKWQNSSADSITTSTATKELKEISGFHLYKLVRSPDKFTWYIDDAPVFMVADHFNTSSVQMKVIMDLKIDEAWRGSSNQDSAFPMEFRIDYILARMTRNAVNPITTNPLHVIDAPTENKMVWIYVLTSSGGTVVAVLLFLMIILYIRRKTQRSQISRICSPDPVHFTRHNFFHRYPFPSNIDARQIVDLNPFFEFLEIPARQLERRKPQLMILEYCSNGSLLSYLHAMRSTFISHVDEDGNIIESQITSSVTGSECLSHRAKSSLSSGHTVTQLSTSPRLSTDDLVRIAYQIARGLEYLAGRSIIHRDLAARNVLVCENNIVKISDFGLARERNLADYILQNDQFLRRVPLTYTVILVYDASEVLRCWNGRIECLPNSGLMENNHTVRINFTVYSTVVVRRLPDYNHFSGRKVALPIKWMAPESLLERTFSYESDVWSFGVLLWELFSLGETPFTSTTGSKFNGKILEFAHAITNGLRMKRPIYSPLSIYGIMFQCWNIDKDSRPNASILTYEFSTYLTEDSTNDYLLLDEPYQAYNSTYDEFFNSSLRTQMPSEKHTALECDSDTD